MKIIFIENIKGKGKVGDIKEVKDGFAEFLIKEKKAIMATPGNIKSYNNKKQREKEEEDELVNKLETVKEKLEKEIIKIKVKVGKEDKVFGSVSSKQILTALKEKGYNLNKNQIIINNPISSLGYHKVIIELHKRVKAEINVELIGD